MAACEPRFNTNLTVSVAGRDGNGNRFRQTATVENISRHGGRLAEVRCLRGPGDIIQIEHRGRKALFRVIWIDVITGRVGVCCAEDICIWKGRLPESASAAEVPAPGIPIQAWQTGAERTRGDQGPSISEPPSLLRHGCVERRFPRYRCMGGVAANSRFPQNKVWGRLTVIGLGGCYIETMSPFRAGTRLEMLIGAYGVELRLAGQVRYEHPLLGMGIMFTDLDNQQRSDLERVIAAASGR